MSLKRAFAWVMVWIAVALVFTAGIRHFLGSQLAAEFLACYVIEWTLSVDNLFVFLLIFRAFGVEPRHQRRALNWGIVAAIVSRLIFILIGLGLVSLFEPVLYVFGLILLYSAYRMAVEKDEAADIRENRLVKLLQRYLPVTSEYHSDRFFVRRHARMVATPLLLVLIVIDVFDLVFAVDSVPAAFAISRHPFVIFSANCFAICGLRSLYFVLAHAERIFGFLKYGVAIVLAFVGFKMLSGHFIKIDTNLSLIVVLSILILSILLSLAFSPRARGKASGG
jgi:tellurite resistance protein TerC